MLTHSTEHKHLPALMQQEFPTPEHLCSGFNQPMSLQVRTLRQSPADFPKPWSKPLAPATPETTSWS